ncbi:MAG: hypothetical protein JST54_02570 [Deltaproteobacteria bacterium]|nr:hypothetical protein [Deltaproteobacteria bacterium]
MAERTDEQAPKREPLTPYPGGRARRELGTHEGGKRSAPEEPGHLHGHLPRELPRRK